jgi:hypothetical protein
VTQSPEIASRLLIPTVHPPAAKRPRSARHLLRRPMLFHCAQQCRSLARIRIAHRAANYRRNSPSGVSAFLISRMSNQGGELHDDVRDSAKRFLEFVGLIFTPQS